RARRAGPRPARGRPGRPNTSVPVQERQLSKAWPLCFSVSGLTSCCVCLALLGLERLDRLNDLVGRVRAETEYQATEDRRERGCPGAGWGLEEIETQDDGDSQADQAAGVDAQKAAGGIVLERRQECRQVGDALLGERGILLDRGIRPLQRVEDGLGPLR